MASCCGAPPRSPEAYLLERDSQSSRAPSAPWNLWRPSPTEATKPCVVGRLEGDDDDDEQQDGKYHTYEYVTTVCIVPGIDKKDKLTRHYKAKRSDRRTRNSSQIWLPSRFGTMRSSFPWKYSLQPSS